MKLFCAHTSSASVSVAVVQTKSTRAWPHFNVCRLSFPPLLVWSPKNRALPNFPRPLAPVPLFFGPAAPATVHRPDRPAEAELQTGSIVLMELMATSNPTSEILMGFTAGSPGYTPFELGSTSDE